jgi:hypothetical protein
MHVNERLVFDQHSFPDDYCRAEQHMLVGDTASEGEAFSPNPVYMKSKRRTSPASITPNKRHASQMSNDMEKTKNNVKRNLTNLYVPENGSYQLIKFI